MTRFDKRLLGGLDAAAEKTGVPGLALMRLRRRRFRWLPILALLIGFGGYIAVLAQPASPVIGLMAIVLTQALTAWLPLAGPLKVIGGAEMADEFDQARGMRSYLIALACVAFFALTALLVVAGLTLLAGWTREMLLGGVIATAMMIPLLWSALPTLHASWTIEPLDDEE